jgi:3-hydroxybutyryl-CoA dehydrogenase
MDLIGIDINAGAMRSMYEQTYGEPRYKPHHIQMQKLAAGELGRKTGRGFYHYGDEAASAAQPPKAGGRDRLLLSAGSWAPQFAEVCQEAGFEPGIEAAGAAAGFALAGWNEDLHRVVLELDRSLAAGVPLFVQCADVALSEILSWVKNPQRVVGFDGLFIANGAGATLIDSQRLDSKVHSLAEQVISQLGRRVFWVHESPAVVVPRIVCQLVNEAAFAQLEGVASGETIDLAMRLGVNYPRGPLEWGAALGYDKVVAVLDHLYNEYHEERYRACVLLRRWARGAQ